MNRFVRGLSILGLAILWAAGGWAKEPQIVENSVGMKLIAISSGEFTMGSTGTEDGHEAGEQEHRVSLSKPFHIGMTEVTQAQWNSLMTRNPSPVKGDQLPVTMVKWSEATEFCKKLSEKEGKTYRLPTEAEWEYACRSGKDGPLAGAKDLDQVAWMSANSQETPHPVAGKEANAWGLYDTLGNVAEWCLDVYQPELPGEAVTDPTGPAEGNIRVVRGGGWDTFPPGCRCAARCSRPESHPYKSIGFRALLED